MRGTTDPARDVLDCTGAQLPDLMRSTMNHTALLRYRRLYRSATRMGADRIFSAYAGLDPEFPVAMSVSHGVDFGSWDKPLDVEAAEPVHWAYNDLVYKRSKQYKPTIFAPHPFILLGGGGIIGGEASTLVIAAAPGPENDRNLLAALKGRTGRMTVLVKPRGDYLPSLAFWRSHGFQAQTAGPEGRHFYQNLHSILSQASHVIGCSFSSALIFAAALGKDVEILPDYWQHTYTSKYGKVDYGTGAVRDVVLTLMHRNRAETTICARELLGADKATDPVETREAYLDALRAARSPLYFRRRHSRPVRYLLAETARLTGRVGVLNNLRQGIVDELFGREIYATRINELSLWMTGDPDKYYDQTRATYVKGKTEGGLAVCSYGEDPIPPTKT